MSVELALQRAITEIPDCVAAGHVDLSTGMLLGIRTVDSHPSEVMDLLAAATADLFQGNNVIAIEGMFKRARGVQDNRHYFQEIIVNSDNLVHVFVRSRSNEDQVSCFVCRKSVNLGMAITKARQTMMFIQEAVA